jgi:hypothetical protein
MKKFLVLALVGLLASSANAAVLGLHGGSGDGPLHGPDNPLVLNISETADIYMTLGLVNYNYYYSPITDPDIGQAQIFMDTVQILPEGDIYGEDYEILGVLNPGDPGFLWDDHRDFPGDMAPYETGDLDPGDPQAITFDGPVQGYALLGYAQTFLTPPAEMPPEPLTWNTNTYVLDVITIHCTGVSVDELYFESPTTVQPQGISARKPVLFVQDSTTEVQVLTGASPDTKTPGQAALASAIIFENGYVDRSNPTPLFWYESDPFVIQQLIPEPTSLALLAIGGLALLRRKK